MSSIGHNKGPSLEPGYGFRKAAWGKARKSLLKTLPIEILRLRVARAKRLGLDYKTYASIRAASGHDVLAFLYSGNALELTPRRLHLSDAKRARLIELNGAALNLAAIYPPSDAETVQQINVPALDACSKAPGFTASWSETRAQISALLRSQNLPADGVVLVPATAVEREWCAAAKLAGMIPAEHFFQR